MIAPQHPRQQPEQGGLPRAAWTEHQQSLALFDAPVDCVMIESYSASGERLNVMRGNVETETPRFLLRF